MADGGSITWRIGLSGADGVRSDLKSVGPAAAEGARIAQAELRRIGIQADDTASRYERMAAQIRQSAAQAAATPVQQRISGLVDSTGAGSARESAAFFAEAEEQARALRAAINPLAVAQERFNLELSRAQALARGGLITTGELAQAETRLRQKLDETTAAYRRQEAAQTQAKKGGLSVNQKNTLIYTASDIVSSAGSGIDPMRMLLQQGPQVLQAFAVEGMAVSGAFIAASAAAAGYLAVIGGLIAIQIRAQDEQAKLTVLLEGAGRASGVTAAQIHQVADAAAASTTQSIRFSRDAATTFATTAKVTEENLTSATSMVDRFADATGKSSKDALNELARAFASPADGAKLLNDQLTFLTGNELDHIKSVEITQGKTEALKLVLEKLNGTLPKSGAAVIGVKGAWDSLAKSISDVITKLEKLNQTPAWSPEKRLQGLYEMRRNVQAGVGVDTTGDYQKNIRDAVAATDRMIADVKKQIEEAKAKPAREHRIEDINRVDEAVGKLNPKDDQIQTVKDRQEVARKALRGEIATEKTPEELRAAIAAGDKEIAQIKKRGEHVDRHAESLARDSKAMAENTAGALASAQAYLESSEIALKADARRKASTDAARKGANEEQRYQAQLNLMVAEAAANGAKSVDQLRTQTDVRRDANDAVASGLLTSKQADQQMQDELALRPLLTAQKVADGEALRILTRVIAEYRKALHDAHEEEARGAAIDISRDQNETYQALARRRALADRAKPDRFDEEGIRIQARKRLESQGIDPSSDQGRNLVARDVYNARLDRDVSKAESASDRLQDLQREHQLLADELTAIGKNADAMEIVRAVKAAELDLIKEGIGLETEKGRAIVQQARDNALLQAEIRRVQDSYNDLKGMGDKFLDDVLNPQAWKNWGDTGTRIIEQVMSDFIRLAALNPLKNMLFGESNPTLSSVGGIAGSLLGSLFGGANLSASANALSAASSAGGAGWDAAFSAANAKLVPGYASGTDGHPGGWADVGEHGRERIWLPPGTKVFTSAETRAMDARVAAPAVIQAPATAPAGMKVEVNDYRSSGARPKVSQTADGIRMDLYDDIGRDMISRAGSSGDLARAMGQTPRVKRYGG
ncbi:phage tail length tape measure family protein [Caulobacter sp. 1776]|uniref:phage tail length tape measure family protein n=1 Tax=Caulobacter sp. 1776 TaxID=3156420 RepID=UPI00339A4201